MNIRAGGRVNWSETGYRANRTSPVTRSKPLKITKPYALELRLIPINEGKLDFPIKAEDARWKHVFLLKFIRLCSVLVGYVSPFCRFGREAVYSTAC